MTTIVAIDIETTGLDPNRDAVTEIGAVRFNLTRRRIEDEWSTLVNPGRAIPEQITQLTGITNDMVRHAPRLPDVVDDLAAFVGDFPILGQNVRFDLAFLQKQRLFAWNDVIDTYEMAAVLLPTASRYNLGALGQLLGVPLPATHRALDDARVTHGVFLRLWDLTLELPLDLLAEIVRHGEPLDWDGNWIFQQAMRLRSREPAGAKRVRRAPASGPLFADDADAPRLQPVETPVPLNSEEVAAVLEYGGPFSHYFQFYEQRPEQVEMLRAVSDALSYGTHLLVEAGTGVGKSFAYLVPAAYFALQNNTRVVVSTNTINLQDQLIRKDIPDLRAALGMDGADPRIPPLRAAVLKGRSNYLCPRRVEMMRHTGPRDVEEMRTLAKVLVWQLDSDSGDRNEINLTRPGERDAWMRLSAEDDACTADNCAGRMGGACPFYRAKQAALNAHILIVNHALLLSDVATGSRVLPDYQYLIVDEAHHLEAATTNALSFRFTQTDMERMLREMGGPTAGILGSLLSITRNLIRPSDFAQLSQLVNRAADLGFRLDSMSKDFYFGLGEFIKIMREGQPPSMYNFQVRIVPATRTQTGWDNVEITWDSAGETMRLLINNLAEIHKAVSEIYADGNPEVEDVLGSLSSLYRRMSEAEANISAMIHEPAPNLVYWIEVHAGNNRLALNAAPLRVGPLIQKFLWHEKNSVILTSATLTTYNQFDYIKNTLSADEADTLMLGSPFDYESAALLYIPSDMPEPNSRDYEYAINRALIQLCAAVGGRTLALFTSYAHLKRTSQAISGPLAQQGITVYEQGEGASANALLDAFKTTERAVLLGTRSFWEGVDVPGEALQVVVITKLPFDVPSDPLIAARAETFEDPFNEYHIPEAILRFRQGFGRLIRSAQDRGVVAILDKRVLTKQYGRLFLESLPNCTRRQGSLNDLPKAAVRWLNL